MRQAPAGVRKYAWLRATHPLDIGIAEECCSCVRGACRQRSSSVGAPAWVSLDWSGHDVRGAKRCEILVPVCAAGVSPADRPFGQQLSGRGLYLVLAALPGRDHRRGGEMMRIRRACLGRPPAARDEAVPLARGKRISASHWQSCSRMTGMADSASTGSPATAVVARTRLELRCARALCWPESRVADRRGRDRSRRPRRLIARGGALAVWCVGAAVVGLVDESPTIRIEAAVGYPPGCVPRHMADLSLDAGVADVRY